MVSQYQEAVGYHLSSQQSALHGEQLWHAGACPAAVIEVSDGASLDRAKLRSALEVLVRDHEILRTAYRPVPGLRYPLQYIVEPGFAWCERRETLSDEQAMALARANLDADHGVVSSVVLTPCSSGQLKIVLAAWVGSLDAPALTQLAQRWLAIYAGDEDTADEDTVQYADYAAWQSEVLESELGREGTQFWTQRLTERAAPLLTNSSSQPSETPIVVEHICDPAQVESIERLARNRDVTTEQVMLAASAAFWSRRVGEPAVWIDWHCAARTAEIGDTLGRFSLKLPFEIRVDPSRSFTALLQDVARSQQVLESWRECFDATAPGASLVQGLEFDALRIPALPGGFVLKLIDSGRGSGRLKLSLIELPRAFLLRWSANDPALVGWLPVWQRQFAALLREICLDPESPLAEHSSLDANERQQLADFSRSEGEFEKPSKLLLHELIEQQADRVPANVAVICGDRQLTYRELNDRANRLAGVLRSRGAVTDRPVGIHLGRSVEWVVAILAVLKAGGAYVPLDAEYPEDRIRTIADDAGCNTVLTTIQHRSSWPASTRVIDLLEEPDVPAATERQVIGASNLAYIIYTSGSTGRPKGVMVSHANAVASTLARWAFYQDRVSCFLLLSSFSFDSSVAGLFWTLSQGGALCIPTDDQYRDPNAIAGLLQRHAVSHLLTVPSFYSSILAQLPNSGALRCAIVAGETCHQDLVGQHRAQCPDVMLVNEYGPTEGTVWSTAHVLTRSGGHQFGNNVPIGKPIAFSRNLVLDEHLRRCAIGVPGELYIGGEGVTRGYWHRAELTAERFIADPFAAGQRLYRSGDLARFLPSGEIEYLGRIDDQVKIRGHRVELGEIESWLTKQPAVSEAVVIAVAVEGSDVRLVAYITPADSAVFESPDRVRPLRESVLAAMRAALPAYMVPSKLIVVREFPRSPNGKVERRALQAVDDAIERPEYVAPRTAIEQTLARIWESLLKVTNVGLNDDFFDLGGHSLLATQVSARVRQALHVELPLREVFEYTSLQALANALATRIESAGDELNLMEQLVAEGEVSA